MFLWSQAQQAEHSQQGGEHTDTGHRHSHCLAEQCHGWSDSCSSIPAQAVPGKLGAAKAGWVCLQRQLLSTGLVVPSLRHPHVQTAPQPGVVFSSTLVTYGPWRVQLRSGTTEDPDCDEWVGVRNAGHGKNGVHKLGGTSRFISWQTHLLST